MRCLAWLHAAPDPEADKPKKSKTPPERISRMTQYRDAGQEVPLPELDRGMYLVEYLLEAGPVMPAGMGAAVISFQELEAWQCQTGNDLQPWEVRMLRRLSGEYLAESQRADKPDCPAPWQPKPTEIDREAVSKKVGQALRMLMDTRPRR